MLKIDQTRTFPSTLEDKWFNTGRTLGNLAKIAFVTSAIACTILFSPLAAQLANPYGLKVIAISAAGINILLNTSALFLYNKSFDNAQHAFDKATQEAADAKANLKKIQLELAALHEKQEKIPEKPTEKINPAAIVIKPDAPAAMPMISKEPPQHVPDPSIQRAPAAPARLAVDRKEQRKSSPPSQSTLSTSTSPSPKGGLIRRKSELLKKQLEMDAESPQKSTETPEVHAKALNTTEIFAEFKLKGTLSEERKWNALGKAFSDTIGSLPADDSVVIRNTIFAILEKCTGYSCTSENPSKESKALLNTLVCELLQRDSVSNYSKEKMILALAEHSDRELFLNLMRVYSDSYLNNDKALKENEGTLQLLIVNYHKLCMKENAIDTDEKIKPFLRSIVLQIGVLGSVQNMDWLTLVMKDLFDKKLLTQAHLKYCVEELHRVYSSRINELRLKIPYRQIVVASTKPDFNFVSEPSDEELAAADR